MARDRHLGRGTPTFVVEGDPNTFIGLIRRHGVASRIMRARACPCMGANYGTPDTYCNLCHGDGYIYDFQRKLLQADEDSDVKKDRTKVHPFRVPILEPIKVERLLPPEQGGIKVYDIVDYDQTTITISGTPLPRHWQKMRVSYWFDRYNLVEGEVPDVNVNTKTLTVTGPRYDDGHRTGNVMNATGDIALVNQIKRPSDGYVFTNFSFTKNKIYLKGSEPDPDPDDIEVTYYYAPTTQVLVADLSSRKVKEKWMGDLPSGSVMMSFEPWYELGSGDLITLLTPEFTKNEVISHGDTGVDKLLEFDVSEVDDVIFDQDGTQYREGEDWVLQNFHDVVWIAGGKQPASGTVLSVRYNYHPTYTVFQDQGVPNALENKLYPKSVLAKLWGRTLNKESETLENARYSY